MAKKKSKSSSKQQTKFSPERYMREKVRTLPIGKCYITHDWEESGISHILVTRIMPSGNFIIGIFLVDTFCIGIKDSTYKVNISEPEYIDLIEHYKYKCGLDEISYDETHNIIYGAIAFAEEAGIRPVKEFNIAKFVLQEDTEEIPLIEYDYGKNGKHFLVINSDRRELPYFYQLKKTLGDDFEYIGLDNEESDYNGDLTLDDINRGLENWQKMMAESNRHPKEEYSYTYPEYPKTLEVKYQFIADELLSADNYDYLSEPVIKRILSLPHDEVAEDIAKIVMYEIGRTYKSINDDTIGKAESSAILHALYLLAQIGSEKGLDAVLEIMRQNDCFADYHLGDFAPEIIHTALYSCGLNNVQAIELYLYQPGLSSYLRSQAIDALAMVVFLNPGRRDEIIEIFRKLLKSMIVRLPVQEACDGNFAGFMMGNLMDLEAKELIPEIKAVFDTDCVDKSISGDCDAVVSEIQNGCKYKDKDKYKIPNIYHQYEIFKSINERYADEQKV